MRNCLYETWNPKYVISEASYLIKLSNVKINHFRDLRQDVVIQPVRFMASSMQDKILVNKHTFSLFLFVRSKYRRLYLWAERMFSLSVNKLELLCFHFGLSLTTTYCSNDFILKVNATLIHTYLHIFMFQPYRTYLFLSPCISNNLWKPKGM